MTVAGLIVERRRADRPAQDKAASQRLMVQTLLSLTGIRDARDRPALARARSGTRACSRSSSDASRASATT